jgi:four helix bundle protein
MELVVEVYKLTGKFPREEQYGLSSQMKRAAVSIPSNIAEGRLRGYEKEFRQFLLTAFGSGGELETQIEVAKQLAFVSADDYIKIDLLLNEVMKMLNVMISNLAPNS